MSIYMYKPNTEAKSYWDYETINKGESKTFFKIADQGVIKKFWCTSYPKESYIKNILFSKQLILHIYWDESVKAAISVPLADFFCQQSKLGRFENAFFSAANDQFVFDTRIPMPFRSSARFELENNSEDDVTLFYGLDVELKKLEKKALYLHTCYSSHKNLPFDTSFYILPELNGTGRFLGTHISIQQTKPNENWAWYTRPISIYLDQKDKSKKAGYFINTLDDYISSAWWDREPQHDEYYQKKSGRPHVKQNEHELNCSFYRYHTDIPLQFSENCCIEIGANWNFSNQEIGTADWRTVCFFYLSTHFL